VRLERAVDVPWKRHHMLALPRRTVVFTFQHISAHI
jgi:hypothetical protein